MLPDNLIIHEGVEIGPGAKLEGPLVIGQPPRDRAVGELPVFIGSDCHIRPFSTIYAGSTFGDRLQTGQGVTIREDNRFGEDVSVGTNATLEFGNRIGNRVRIHSGAFLELTGVGDDVFIGPNAVFCDDPHPMGCSRYQECLGGPRVGAGASIGANVTILPGVTIGENALIGAGSVVVSDIPANTVAVGNPARVIKEVKDLECPPGFYSRPYEWKDRPAQVRTTTG